MFLSAVTTLLLSPAAARAGAVTLPHCALLEVDAVRIKVMGVLAAPGTATPSLIAALEVCAGGSTGERCADLTRTSPFDGPSLAHLHLGSETPQSRPEIYSRIVPAQVVDDAIARLGDVGLHDRIRFKVSVMAANGDHPLAVAYVLLPLPRDRAVNRQGILHKRASLSWAEMGDGARSDVEVDVLVQRPIQTR